VFDWQVIDYTCRDDPRARPRPNIPRAEIREQHNINFILCIMGIIYGTEKNIKFN